MPVITIDMWKGKTAEEKENMIKKVTKAVSDSMQIPIEAVHIIINETSRENWGIGGKQASKMEFEKK